MITVALIGKTGNGKSTLGNALLGGTDFKASDNAESCTTNIHAANGRFAGQNIRVIDTPGLADSEGRDEEHMTKFTQFLIDSKDGVNAFVITLSGAEPRFDANLQALFNVFEAILGKDFWNHVILVFNKCDLPKTKRKCKESFGGQIRTLICNKHADAKRAFSRGGLQFFAISAEEHDNHAARQADPEWIRLVETIARKGLFTCETFGSVAAASEEGKGLGEILESIVRPMWINLVTPLLSALPKFLGCTIS
jgi:predicted GTPase